MFIFNHKKHPNYPSLSSEDSSTLAFHVSLEQPEYKRIEKQQKNQSFCIKPLFFFIISLSACFSCRSSLLKVAQIKREYALVQLQLHQRVK